MFGRLFNLPNSENRAISFQTIWGAGETFAFTTDAGTNITQRKSLEITTVYSCARLIADTVSTLPVDAFRRVQGNRVPLRPKPIWVDSPDIEVSVTRSVGPLVGPLAGPLVAPLVVAGGGGGAGGGDRALRLHSLQLRVRGQDRKSTRLNSSHSAKSRMPSSA